MTTPGTHSASYVQHVAKLEHRLNTDDALRRAVGGEFIAIGKLEYHLLRSRGLKDNHLVVDVGCGSGRLASQLASFPQLRYIGCDVVPRLLDYAAELCERPDWNFAVTDGVTIPCESAVADFVCFFSVFTHLSQDDIYRYFREANRVLKPGGLLIMSFLEFKVPAHWAAFIASVDRTRDDHHLNQFIERDSIRAWAAAAGFYVRSIHPGDTLYIPLPDDVVYESGARASGAGSLGQSLAVLQKSETFPGAPLDRNPSATAGLSNTVAATGSIAAGVPVRDSDASAFRNVSARAYVPAGGSATVGFMLDGTSEQRVLVRAIGPSLSVFGVPNPIKAPSVEVFGSEVRHAHASAGWRGDEKVAAAARHIGAFTIDPSSNDAALLVTLPPGNYTAVVKGLEGADCGEVLLEIYLLS